jgi:molecular chaperone Hsp33
MEAEACACLVELMSAALLLQSRTFFSERLQLMLKGSGRAKAVVADSWPEGDIRGMLDLGEAADAAAWIQGPGTFRVMRSTPAGQPYMGTLELVEGPIQTQVEAYLLQSEQVQASVTLWCDPRTGEAGGLLVEPLPNCPRERLERLVEAIEGLEVVPLWERQPDFLARWLNQGEGAEILSSQEIQYRCRCSRATLVETLRGFTVDKLDEIFIDAEPVEIRCDYCAQTYRIQRAELLPAGTDSHAEA